MKSPMLLNAPFFFLFVLFATTLPSTRAINLFDDSGDPIRSGDTYYMLPVATGSGGGPTLRQTGNDECPLTIVLDTDSSSSGLPVRLTDTQGTYHVMEGYAAYIQFVGNNVPSCVPSDAKWGTVDKNLKVVNNYSGFQFTDYFGNPGKHQYVISYCYWLDRHDCLRVASINNTLVWSYEADAWVVKFKKASINSERHSWSVV